MTKRHRTNYIMEVWNDISEYKGLYKVSNLGNVARVLKSGILKPVKRRKNDECVPQSVNLSKDGKKTSKSVMRLVFYSFLVPENTQLLKMNTQFLKNRVILTPKDGKMSNCSQFNIKWSLKNESQMSELSKKEQKFVNEHKYISFFKAQTENWYFKFKKTSALTEYIAYSDGNYDFDYLTERYEMWLDENSD